MEGEIREKFLIGGQGTASCRPLTGLLQSPHFLCSSYVLLESCKRQVCHKVTCKDYERKEFIHGDKERVKEQYFPANTDV